MADELLPIGQLGNKRRLKDMNDGSFSDVVSAKINPVAGSTGNYAAPAAATAATVSYAAVASKQHAVDGWIWSYSGGLPVGGNMQISDGGSVIVDYDITDQGAGIILLPSPLISIAANSSMIFTLASGGAGVSGKLSILGYRQV